MPSIDISKFTNYTHLFYNHTNSHYVDLYVMLDGEPFHTTASRMPDGSVWITKSFVFSGSFTPVWDSEDHHAPVFHDHKGTFSEFVPDDC